MAQKKKIEIDSAAAELRDLREQIRTLQKRADGLKDDLISRFGLGVHNGFVILERARDLIDQDLLKAQLGDLTPFKKPSKSTFIEFPRQSDAA